MNVPHTQSSNSRTRAPLTARLVLKKLHVLLSLWQQIIGRDTSGRSAVLSETSREWNLRARLRASGCCTEQMGFPRGACQVFKRTVWRFYWLYPLLRYRTTLQKYWWIAHKKYHPFWLQSFNINKRIHLMWYLFINNAVPAQCNPKACLCYTGQLSEPGYIQRVFTGVKCSQVLLGEMVLIDRHFRIQQTREDPAQPTTLLTVCLLLFKD